MRGVAWRGGWGLAGRGCGVFIFFTSALWGLGERWIGGVRWGAGRLFVGSFDGGGGGGGGDEDVFCGAMQGRYRSPGGECEGMASEGIYGGR